MIQWSWFVKLGATIGVIDGLLRVIYGFFRVGISSVSEAGLGFVGVMVGTLPYDIALVAGIGYFSYVLAVRFQWWLHKPIVDK